MALEIKTPGVFIRELNAIPNAIVGVETAVPVFVGYTEIANKDGHPVKLVPTPIGSVAEYSRIFGRAYQALFQVEPAVDGDADFLAGGQGYKLNAGKNFNLYDSIRLFYANGGGHCFIVSTGSYADDLAQRASTLQAGLAAVHDLAGPTMLVIPEATLLDLKDYRTLRQAMLKQCFDKQDRVAILDVIGTDRLPPTAGAGNPPASPKAVEDYLHDKVADFRDGLDAAPDTLKYGMAYAPFLKTSLVAASDFSFDNFDSSSEQTVTTVIESEIDRLHPAPDSRGQSLKNDLRDVWAADPPTRTALSQRLASQIPLLQEIFAAMAASRGTLPPSPAIAGVYTQVDATRGVWHAPANFGLIEVTAPTLLINDTTQQDLNMPIDGFAVNAIREFVGRGTLVWGARTLDGNSSDWRYIPVRRALIYVEQSVKLALARFVFEPNVEQTWVTVTSMVAGFMRGLWQVGGLIGATPQDAFWVKCGLGSTMTAQDLLDGRLIVEIGLAPVRPAEFIVLRIGQQMQGATVEPPPHEPGKWPD